MIQFLVKFNSTIFKHSKTWGTYHLCVAVNSYKWWVCHFIILNNLCRVVTCQTRSVAIYTGYLLEQKLWGFSEKQALYIRKSINRHCSTPRPLWLEEYTKTTVTGGTHQEESELWNIQTKLLLQIKRGAFVICLQKCKSLFVLYAVVTNEQVSEWAWEWVSIRVSEHALVSDWGVWMEQGFKYTLCYQPYVYNIIQ